MHTIDEHFSGRSEKVREIYRVILDAAREFGPYEEDPKKTSIHLNRRSAFSGIQTRRDFLILTVKSRAEIDNPRISKREQASANRWHNEIKITSAEEVDDQIVGWLRDSYDISG